VGAGELQKGQPILCFLAPASTDATSLGEPSERSLHHPAACWVLLFFCNGFWYRFIAAATVANVLLIVRLANQLVDISVIIPFVQA